MNVIPYVTIGWCIVLSLFELFLQKRYKTRELIKKNFCYLDNNHINIYNFYKIITSLITHTQFIGHFIPNIIITAVFGTLLERLIGNIKMLIYSLGCLFIYWPIIFLFRIKSKTGCGFSAIFYSFFSIYFTILSINEENKQTKIIYLVVPFVILVLIHIFGKIKSTSSEFIHVLSLLYGYIIGLYEYSQS
jgi:membrane associated rhomboid family serine protease